MEKRESFVFYRSFYEAIKNLKDRDRVKIYDAICEYGLNENEIELQGICKGILAMAKPIISSSKNRYNACVENGKKGGRPKKAKPNQNQIITNLGFENEKPNKNQIGFENEKPKTNLNDNVNVNDNDNVNIKEKDKEKEKANDSCVDGLQEIIEFYNNNIGMISPYSLEIIQDYLKEMPKELVLLAMKKSVEANIRTIKYIKGILNNWSKKGIKTVVEAEKEDEEFRNKKNITMPKEETEEEAIQRKLKSLKEELKKDESNGVY